MAKKKDKENKISVLDAVETLSAVAEVDVSSQEAQGIAKEADSELFDTHLLEPKTAINNPERIKQSFKAIHDYLKEVVEEKRFSLKSDETQQGIKAIIQIAEEAAEKVQKYSAIFKGAQEGMVIPEFQDLYDFYLSKIVRKLENVLAEEDKWKKKWEEEHSEDDLEKKSLKDLETVRKDHRYDLFYIRDEDGRSFFNKNLLRHISLVGTFDEFFTALETDDPFLKVQIINDNLIHGKAKTILGSLRPHTDVFFKNAFKYKDDPFIAALIKAYMALSLAANPQNTLQSSSNKHTTLYFNDFICFVREAIESTAYQQLIKISSKDKFFMEALYLTHTYCSFIFTTTSDMKDSLELVHSMVNSKAFHEEVPNIHTTPMAIWHTLVNEDEKIRSYLKRFPSGPLMKALDILRDGEYQSSFDPLLLGYYPDQLFTFSWNKLHVSVAKIPCPIDQIYINEADITPEFKGYIKHLGIQLNPQKLLFINLQDRTSHQEYARCVAMEELQDTEEAKEVLKVITLSKDGSFYNQTDEYRLDVDAKEFKKQFLDQLGSGENCGFYFPKSCQKQVLTYAKKVVDMVHEAFFSSKKIFTRKNRLDFIEICYLFLILNIIENESPDVMFFSCKDAVDNSSSELISFYIFLKLLINGEDVLKEDHDFILHTLYSSSLLSRERAIDIKRISRFVSALAVFHAEMNRDKQSTLKAIKELLPTKFLDSLSVSINT